MPKFSVIVPAYNVERYLADCLKSIQAQSWEDFEVVVVDDASTDGTAALAERFARKDERIRVVRHPENKGRHLARATGVAAATGELALFLDSDDEYEGTHLLERLAAAYDERPADIIRFALAAHPYEGMPAEDARAFESWSNCPCDAETALEAAELAFDLRHGYHIPWHVSHRLFAMPVIKEAFARIPELRLELGEDAVEYFYATSVAATERTDCSIGSYSYRMGAGITNVHTLPRERFAHEAGAMRDSYEEAARYARELGDERWLRLAEGLKLKLVESTANIWHERVRLDERADAARDLVDIVGPAEAAHELWRFVRDAAYVFVATGTLPEPDDELYVLRELALAAQPDEADRSELATRSRAMRRSAEEHLSALERGLAFRDRVEASERAEPRIRIFVTTHQQVDAPTSDILQLVQVGPGLRTHRFPDALRDDEGEGISELNDRYCELTTQYWAWKNVDTDYVGFCHYRRYFDFSEQPHEENDFGEIIDDFIDADAVRRYGLDDASIRRAVEGYDVVTTCFQDLRDFPGDFATPREQWHAGSRLHDEDLELMASILCERHPDYRIDVEAFLSAHTSCFCNMYIMRQTLFRDYCAWLFPLLEEFCARADMSRYSHESLRTPGHLAERLFNIYYLHAVRSGAPWRTKQLQCVHFLYPQRAYPTEPTITELRCDLMPRDVVPVVLAADDNYVPMLTTTILSMLENADPTRFYDIVIFERDIRQQRKEEMQAFFARFENASVRFHNVWRQVAAYDLGTSNEHISIETFYRFLIQEVLPGYDKVLYLDSDLVVLGDVARLFDVDVEGSYLAAVTDIDFVGNVCGADPARLAYARDVLKLKDPYAYFQAGVLVLNTAELRRLHSVREWLVIAAAGGYIYDDQDILNAECQDAVVTLPAEWNVTHDCDGRVGWVYSFAPADLYDAYQDARKHPQIIHYAGYEKPWTWLRCDYSQRYWEYARKMPFYEELVDLVAQKSDERHDEWLERKRLEALPPKAVSEESPLRAVIDPIAPLGSQRRELLKSIGRQVNKLRGGGTAR